jgi:hypothetical protein
MGAAGQRLLAGQDILADFPVTEIEHGQLAVASLR